MPLLSLIHVAFIHVAFAQDANGIVTHPTVPGFDNPDTIGKELVGQVCNATTWLFAGAILLSIVFALLAGIEYMRSSGDPGKVKTATNRILFAAIGVAVALVAFLFPGMIAQLLNVASLGNVCSV